MMIRISNKNIKKVKNTIIEFEEKINNAKLYMKII